MSPGPSPPQVETDTSPDARERTGSIQLLVEDAGNRQAITRMLDSQFDVLTDQSVTDADLYLVEDQLLPALQSELQSQVDDDDPVFCPVVLIRRSETAVHDTQLGSVATEGPLLIDDIIDAPLNQSLLLRRLQSLLIRRWQSQQLVTHVTTLEDRERALRQFERAVEDTGNAIAILDTDGIIEYVNPAFETITGYSEDVAVGRTLGMIQSAEGVDVFDDAFWRTMRDRSEWDGEIVGEREGGQRCVFDTTVTAITAQDGAFEGFVAAMRDVTERIEREQALQNREEELDLLRQVLTRYLRHNLRNDLNVIHGYAELIRATATGEQEEYAETIVEKTNLLSETSDTARRYSSLIERKDDPSRHDLTNIVQSVIADLRPDYPDTSFSIDSTGSCEIVASDGIQDAIAGLIENGAKHNKSRHPQVSVRIRSTDHPQLLIEDNGTGIPDHDLAAINQGQETPLTHSSGVGLWLSKWVIEGAGGRLSFDKTDEGTRVTVAFPEPEAVDAEGLSIPDLKAREQRLQTITNRMTDAIIEVDAGWTITYLDQQAEVILDVEGDEITGRKFWDVFADVRDTEFEESFRETMESRTSSKLEAYYDAIDAWLEIIAYPNFDGGVSLYFRDITYRKGREEQLEQARSRIELALEVTDAAVWEWDLDSDGVTIHPPIHPVLGIPIDTSEDFFANIHPDDRSTVRDALDTAIETDATYKSEYRVPTDNSVRWAEDYGEVQTDDDGEPTRIIGVSRDITVRKTRQRELERSRNLLQQTEELAKTGGWEVDVETGTQEWTEGTYAIHDISPDSDFDPTVDAGIDFYHPDDQDTIEQAVRDCMESGVSYELELRLISADGHRKWVKTAGQPIRTDGDIVAIGGAIQDVTDLKTRELELQERVKELAAFKRATSQFEVSSVSVDELLENFVSTIPDGFQHPEAIEACVTYGDTRKHTPAFEERDQYLSAEAVTENGEQLQLEVVSTSDTAPNESDPFLQEEQELIDALVTLLKGYVERQQYLDERERISELLENAERMGSVGAWEIDMATEAVFWTDGTRRIHGVDEEFEPTFETAFAFVHPDDRGELEERIYTCIDTGQPFELECRIQTADSSERWVEIEGELYSTSGDSQIVRGYMQDITQRKERERRYTAIFDQTYQFTGLMEPDGTLIEANDTALEFGGLEREDVVGKKMWDAYWFQHSDDTRTRARDAVKRAAEGEFVRHDLPVQGDDGEVIIDFSVRPLFDESGDVTLLIPEGRDITALKERENELARISERFRAVFEESFDAMVIIDDDGEYIEANDRAADLCGVTKETLLERSIGAFVPEDFDVEAEWHELHEAGSTRGTLPIIAADGTERIVEYAATANIVPGQHLAILRDITQEMER